MQAVVNITVPFFALVLCGWLAAHRRILPASAIAGLNAFVLYFALPCMLFRFGMNTPIVELLNPAVLGLWMVVSLILSIFTIAVTRLGGVDLKNAAFGALVAVFPNSGFMGVPLLVALLGPQAAGPVICAVLVDMIFTSSMCLGIAQSQGSDGGWRAAVARALKGAMSNPMPWAIALGAVCSATGFKLGGPPYAVVSMLADAASPVALFTIGAVLWRGGQHAQTRAPMRTVAPVVLIKLFVHPLMVFLMGAGARQWGAPLSPFTITVLTLTAALPSASNVSLLAERFGADNGRIARIILGSTALAFVTFTALAWFIGVQPSAPA
jgi:malonate transporter and related proteins